MRAPASRRGFLCGLTTLPLIGGSVTLVGTPTAVDVEPTIGLMVNYAAWLGAEERILRWELSKRVGIPYAELSRWAMVEGDFHFPVGSPWYKQPMPSSRAALVLATVGAPTDLERPVVSWQSERLI